MRTANLVYELTNIIPINRHANIHKLTLFYIRILFSMLRFAARQSFLCHSLDESKLKMNASPLSLDGDINLLNNN